jgi:hypothetical protein
MYQMLGTVSERCMSLARSGLPLAVCAPETTQLLEPAMQSEQVGKPRMPRSQGGTVCAPRRIFAEGKAASGAKEAGEKLAVLKGHDFSRAVSAIK